MELSKADYRTYAIALIFVATLVAFAFVTSHEAPESTTASVESAVLAVDDAVLHLEVVRSPVDRSQGLSGRTTLAEDAGMLFIYSEPDFHGFWMPDMNFPIDIIWLDHDFRVVHIEERVSPESFPHVFRPDAPAQYVVETNAGFAKNYDIEPGKKMEISGIKRR